ncbi:MAG TPA: BTAD domain-containing putative transcriptional regulator, partial [Gemmatimonadaceae bacterium]|nr:BTAD domain-containing putative transcriptional regulator [Gemmatimonadaceae bacterium]
MRANNFRLITLGRFVLLSEGGDEDSLSRRRRKLAVLAVLALATRPYSRDVLVDMFWGEEDEERARHSLSDALSHVRRVLGREAIAVRRQDVALSDAARLSVDALEFMAACEGGEYERAVALYGGPFLDGVYVDHSPRFEAWTARERDRLRRLFLHAAAARCLALARSRRWDECAALARRWLDAEPLSTDAALYLINAHKAPGTREAALTALSAYRVLAEQLAREYESRPDARVSTLAAELEARLATRGTPASAAPADFPKASAARAASAASAEDTPCELPPLSAPSSSARPPNESPRRTPLPPDPRSVPPSAARPARRTSRRWIIAFASVGVMVVLGAAAYSAGRDSSRDATPHARPVVAVTIIQNVRRDTSVAWLVQGLKQMIAADLSRSNGVDVVAPSRVRDVLERERRTDGGSLSGAVALDIAKRVGATWSVSGGITHGGGVYVLDVSVRDVMSGTPLRLFTVTSSHVLDVADQAAARILEAAHDHEPGPHLADVETANLDAYQHYIRSVQAADEGRFADQVRELDLAIAEDSGFVSALMARMRIAAEREHNRTVLEQLGRAFRKAGSRVTEWDRMEHGVYTALHNGERRRAEELGRSLVQRFPRDPRAYSVLAGVYLSHGRWAQADSVLVRQLALDSLATTAGRGPCVPCTAFGGLAQERLTAGDLPGAARAARRWVALQPELPGAWGTLATVLAIRGEFDPALAASRRAMMFAGRDGSVYALLTGRILLMARRYHAVDSTVARWRTLSSDAYQEDAFELESLLERSRGELRASDSTLTRWVQRYPADRSMLLVKATTLGRMGQYTAARALFETLVHSAPVSEPRSPLHGLAGDWARAFCWDHALEADALAGRGDTVRLGVLADSIQRVSARSYYGRDWRLAAHVRGLIALHGQRYAEA